MLDFEYAVQSAKEPRQALADVSAAVEAKGFRVLHVHDVQATLNSKGFPSEPYFIVEVCNARYASQVLARDKRIGLMMPCKINIYQENGKNIISALRPVIMAQFFPEAGLEEIAREVDAILVQIVDASK